MKLEFKFSMINLIGFVVMGGLFYWLCPLPQAPLARILVCGGVGVLLFAACFVVVSHRTFIRQGIPQQPGEKHKRKK